MFTTCPFTGNGAIFAMRPSISTNTPAPSRVSGTKLLVEFRELNPNADAMKSRFELVLSHINAPDRTDECLPLREFPAGNSYFANWIAYQYSTPGRERNFM
jgi:hypothetical protein